MSTAVDSQQQELRDIEEPIERVESYRALSRLAVASFVLAILSMFLVPFPMMLFVPALGTLLGVLGWHSIRRYPDELSGRRFAQLGTLFCALLFVSGSIGHAVNYATEVPDGYMRMSFSALRPDRRRPEQMIPEEALALNGQKVFIKGYIHPGVDGLGKVREFVLVPDMGTCCFGGQPKLWDMIAVVTGPDNQTQYNRRKRKLSGTFKVDTQMKNVQGLGGVLYTLEADSVQ
jgi:hypothetical protein